MADGGGGCTGFEPQSYLRDRCKKCFRLRSMHDLSSTASKVSPLEGKSLPHRPAYPTGPKTTLSVVTATSSSRHQQNGSSSLKGSSSRAIPSSNGGDGGGARGSSAFDTSPSFCIATNLAAGKRRRSWRELGNNSSLRQQAVAGDDVLSVTSSSSSYKTANSKAIQPPIAEGGAVRMSTAKSEESVVSSADSRSMYSAMSGSFIEMSANSLEGSDDDEIDRAVTPTDASEFFVDRDMQRQCWRENAKLQLENDSLKEDLIELKREMEEMRDQYREEEIDEFRDLQRELEQNAKSCRILQFKLRKSERQKDQLLTEKNLVGYKLKELQRATSGAAATTGSESTLVGASSNSGSAPSTSSSGQTPVEEESGSRVGELEAELRIAKEVSVRLHNELESAEDKRYKLEDEVFFYKEKVRELQTQHKWREARNKEEQRRQNKESPGEKDLSPPLATDNETKELRDVLERENDLKEQLRFAEEHLRRTQSRLREVENENEELAQKVSEDKSNKADASFIAKLQAARRPKPPMLRSYSEGHSSISSEEPPTPEEKEDIAQLEARLRKGSLGPISLWQADKNEQNGFSNSTTPRSDEQLLARIRELEKENMQLKSKHASKPQLNGEVVGNHQSGPMLNVASSDEIEECCLLLASVEAQMARVNKQMQKLDIGQKEERRRSLSNKDSAASAIVVDLAAISNELNRVRCLFEPYKPVVGGANMAGVRRPPNLSKSPCANGESKEECAGCQEFEAKLAEESTFYKKKNKELTNQIIETENRWSAEIERQCAEFKQQTLALSEQLKTVREELTTQTTIANEHQSVLETRREQLEETERQLRLTKGELADKVRLVHEMDSGKKALKEWELKYNKLEEIYEREKTKFETDRVRMRAEIAAMKKRTDEAVAELNTQGDGHQRREIMWNEERNRLEKQIDQLTRSADPSTEEKNKIDISSATNGMPVRTINYRVTKMSNEPCGIPELKRKISELEKRNGQLDEEILALRMLNDAREAELQREKQTWQQERDSLRHKNKQQEKVRGAEFDALQLKFTNRLNALETSNKSLNAQLVQIRRERDFHKETIISLEQKLLHSKSEIEVEQRKQLQCAAMFTELERKLTSLQTTHQSSLAELALAKETHQADKRLWATERTHCARGLSDHNEPLRGGDGGESTAKAEAERDRKITEEALTAAENVQRRYAEYQQFYSKEVQRLSSKIKETNLNLAAKEKEYQCKVDELTEQVKLLKIDQRNLIQARESQTMARELVQADYDRVIQAVQQLELKDLSRRHIIDTVMDQLNGIAFVANMRNTQMLHQNEATLRSVIQQLGSTRDEGRTRQNIPITTQQGAGLPHCMGTGGGSGAYDANGDLLLSRSLVSLGPNPVPCGMSNSICLGQFPQLTAAHRSYSNDSSTTWDSHMLDCTARSVTPFRQHHTCCDPTCSGDVNGTQLQKTLVRSASYDRYGEFPVVDAGAGARGGGALPKGVGALTTPPSAGAGSRSLCSNSAVVEPANLVVGRSRMASPGTNVLYKLRRDELAKGQPPSVRALAKAFESMATQGQEGKPRRDGGSKPRGLFSLRKSRSVDQEGGGVPNVGCWPRHPHAPGKHLMARGRVLPPHGGRNPLRNMGTKFVDKVRRSLSRSMSRGRSGGGGGMEFVAEQHHSNTSQLTHDLSAVPFIEEESIRSSIAPNSDVWHLRSSKPRMG